MYDKQQEELNCTLPTRYPSPSLNDEPRHPLHEAAESGSVETVLSLLDLGADVLAADAHGDTPLHVSKGGVNLLFIDKIGSTW